MVSRLTTLKPRPHVAFRATPSGGLLVDIRSGAIFQLNRVGAEVWTTVTGGSTVADATEAVRAKYEVEGEAVEADVVGICDALVAAGLADDAGRGS